MSQSFITEETPAGDFEKITVSSSAVGITASKLLSHQEGGFKKRVVRAFLTVETNSIRIRYDGTNPDSSTGHLLNPGDSMVIEGEQNVSRLKMIRTSADATVQATLYHNI